MLTQTDGRFALVKNPGSDAEETVSQHVTFSEAVACKNAIKDKENYYDIMKVDEAGNLSTEF
jgi:hypothetical protein